ncbi:potassium channel family protein [Leifsonia sp. A12D58]|uniref:potassium channel family protein n=1 Tax=Leifsonia sp. A12D58 TaxID=3397674 RepID=UPI0039DFDA57
MAADLTPDPIQTPRRFFDSTRLTQPGYGTVLLFIGIAYISCAWQKTTDPAEFALLVQLATIWAIFHATNARPRIRQLGTIVLLFCALATGIVWIFGYTGTITTTVMTAASLILYGVAPAAIVRHQAARTKVDGQTLLAIICAYILIGMFFTFAFGLAGLHSDLFGLGTQTTLSTALFFSFTSLTTTGYGNLIPATELGQTLAIMEVLTGQLFVALGIARVVTSWLPRRAS